MLPLGCSDDDLETPETPETKSPVWQKQYIPLCWVNQLSGTAQQLYGVFFSDANTGTAVGGGGTILPTTNGGTTRVTQASGSNDVFLMRVSLIDGNTATVGGAYGTILGMTAGG